MAAASGSRHYIGDTGFENAVDGDRCTMWNSGDFAPQEIRLDLGAPATLDALLMIPAMTPDGPVAFDVALSMDGAEWSLLQRVEADLHSEIPFTLWLAPAPAARWVRVRTLSTPSWVAWFEIAPLRCEGKRR